MLVDSGRRSAVRFVWALILGLFLGGLLTKLVELTLPEGTASREFLLTSVTASVGPLSVDLVAVAFDLGPISLARNFLSQVGIAIVDRIVS
ncbi:MAG: hypothetical protein MK239_04060 [Gemmatimonadetes bacterium]|nr:hypothetical protein [Gemmatimonadota bacterium]